MRRPDSPAPEKKKTKKENRWGYEGTLACSRSVKMPIAAQNARVDDDEELHERPLKIIVQRQYPSRQPESASMPPYCCYQGGSLQGSAWSL